MLAFTVQVGTLKIDHFEAERSFYDEQRSDNRLVRGLDSSGFLA